MRTDVKAGLFLGVVVMLLAAWFFWPPAPTEKPTAVPVGGRNAITPEPPVVRPDRPLANRSATSRAATRAHPGPHGC